MASASEILIGGYIKVGVNDKGTLGVGGNTSPGILYDGAGTGTFNSAYDYLTPGTPFEGFTLSGNSGSAFSATNNNSSLGSAAISGTLTAYNGAAYNGTTYDNRAVWTGTYGGVLSVTNDYYFNDNGQQLNVSTTITALTNVSSLTFARFTDPDAVAASGDSSSTNNFRGSGSVPTSDLVYAEALVSKYVIGLYSTDATTHNTAVTSWTSTTASYLAGASVGNGDNTIGMGFNIGALANGGSITLKYAYIFGTDIAAAIAANGGGGGAPTGSTTIGAGEAYTISQLMSGAVTPVFSGGTLILGSAGTVPADFTVNTAGGAIDTAGYDLTLTGTLTGSGVLDKVGAGVLTLTGANTLGGFNVNGGVLAFSKDAALGDATRPVQLANDATLRALDDVVMTHGLQIKADAQGVLDTGVYNVVLAGDVVGGGDLRKTGAGSLTLSGANSQSTLDIQGGSVIADTPASLGATHGKIVLHEDTRFTSAANMTISQDVNVVGANARFDTGANNVALSGALSGSDCFRKVGTGQLTLLAPGSNAIGACVEQGVLSFNSRFDGNVWVESGGRAGGGGLIDGNVVINGVLSPGNSPGQLVVAGSVTQSPTGVLAIDIDGPTAGVGAGHYDTLVLTGAGSRYTAAGSIAPITRGITGDATNTYTPQIGDAFRVVVAEGGVIGAYSTIVQPTAGMPSDSRFDVVYRPNAIILAVTAKSYATLATGGRINAAQVGGAIDRLREATSTGSAANDLVSGFAGLNKAEVLNALQQSSGEIHADGLDANLRGARATRGQIFGHLDQAFGESRRLWADVDVEDHKVRSDAHAGAYRTNTTSVTLGLDQRLSEHLLAGGALSYGETDVDAGALGSGKSFSYRGHGYAAWRSGETYVNGVVSVGADTYKTNRTLALSSGALGLSSKTQGSSLSADLEAGRHRKFGPATITLAAGLATDNASRDAVSELGNAAGALSFGDETRQVAQGRVGAVVEREAKVGAFVLRPRASLFVTQEFGDDASQLNANLQGQRFAVSAAAPGATAVRFAAALEASLSDRTKLGLGYRYVWSDNAEGHTFRAVVSVAW
jgi:uncharacterized protein with beta-barrel porin domain